MIKVSRKLHWQVTSSKPSPVRATLWLQGSSHSALPVTAHLMEVAGRLWDTSQGQAPAVH